MATWLRKHGAELALLGLAAAMAAIVRLEGRVWFCQCQQLRFIVASAWSTHTSQHLLDPYTLSHLQHGLVFYWGLLWLWPRSTWQQRLVLAALLEAAWEIAENSPLVINRYREATAALGYEGDSVVNTLGDLLAAVAGFALAGRLGLRGTIALFAAVEAAMLLAIRDSLLLNVLMLAYPIEAIRQWQMAQ